MDDREKLIEAVRNAKTFDDVVDAFRISGSSPEAYYAWVVWEALRGRDVMAKHFEDIDPAELRGMIEKLATDLLSIAEDAMPPTYFATDSRCQHARKVLKELQVRK